jgi:hypothetical protein
VPDDLSAELTKAKSIADGLHFACKLPDKTPDFTACGGPAAEAYWDYFTPARIVALVAALEAVLEQADRFDADASLPERVDRNYVAMMFREAITAALTREESSDAGT